MNQTLIKAVFNIMINYLTYYYLERFETIKCECGYDVRRDIAKVMLLTSYLLIVGKLMFPNIPPSAALFVVGYTIVYDIVFVSYIFSLKKKKCECDDTFVDQTTNMMYLYYMLIVFIMLFTLSVVLIFTPLCSMIMKK